MPLILILEDDITFSLMLSTWLGKKNMSVHSVATVAEAKRKIEAEHYDLILSDLRLPDGDGMDLLRWLKASHRSIPFIIMTGYAEIQTAVQSIKLGASDYIAKPLNPESLWVKIHECIGDKPRPSAAADLPVEGECPLVRQMYQHIRLVAPTDMSVLIVGSSGTGKEHVARRLHGQSSRKDAPFVAVDCGAIPKELAVSEFFGHVKGSFTGAIDHKTGAFEAAQGGTVFLDEIGNLSYEVQIQLLRALQERCIKPVGSNREIKIDIRLISATNENLPQAIRDGAFREDLYHRINEFSLRVPDLKDRGSDILLYAAHFLEAANRELHKQVKGFDADTTQLFLSYPWPGNLRQMKNVIKYATLLADADRITRRELPEEMTEPASTATSVTSLRDETYERNLIVRALQEAGHNKALAARMLGIDRKTLYNKLKSLRIED
jgi:two-component system response regulator HydG